MTEIELAGILITDVDNQVLVARTQIAPSEVILELPGVVVPPRPISPRLVASVMRRHFDLRITVEDPVATLEYVETDLRASLVLFRANLKEPSVRLDEDRWLYARMGERGLRRFGLFATLLNAHVQNEEIKI